MKKKTQYFGYLTILSLLFLSFYYSVKINESLFQANKKPALTRNALKLKRVTTVPDNDPIKNTIKTPESPVTGANVPNSIKDIKAANPSVGVQAIALPTANNMGTANVQFPIKLPTGRKGMQPQVVVSYNSEGGNGWLGLGWDVSFPSIGIETRWGVPRYSRDLETETYIMGGEQLTPVAHREDWVNRTAEKRFFPRREGAFDMIIRHGDNPKNYWWEVISKNGTKSYYGGLPTEGVLVEAVLKDDEGNIAHWALVEVRDNNDNFMRYHYTVVEDNGLQGSTVKGTQLYIDKITYTGHKNTEGVYSVHFMRDRQLNEGKRTDITINARLGFKQVTADLLRKIEVKFKETLIRSYELTYKQGAFYKTLLTSVAEFDKNGKQFYKHDFDYFDEVRSDGEYYPFKNPKNWAIPFDNIKGRMLNSIDKFKGHASAISSASSKTWNAGIGLRAGFYDGFLASPSNTIGGNFNYSKAESEGLIALVDINGDGLPDKVFRDKDSLYYRPNIKRTMSFGAKRSIKGIHSFSHSKTTTKTWGVDGYPGYVFHIGKSWSNSKTTVDTYFIDYNGDGLIDIASKGIVYFNSIINGEPIFSPDSRNTPISIQNRGAIHDSIAPVDTAGFQRLIDDNPLHDVVRMWRVPYKGKIRIDAPIRLLQDTNAINYQKNDGIFVAIQKKGEVLWRDSIKPDNYRTQYPENVTNIDVDTGQTIYFRLQSKFDGAYDQVIWSPKITYISGIDSDIDANNKPVHIYEATKDYIVASPQFVGMPSDGRILVKSTFRKPITSDDIALEIFRRKGDDEERIYEKSLAWNDTVTSLTDIGFDVNEKDEIKFRIHTNTEIDWSNIQWIPRVYYASYPNDTTGSEIYPAVEYTTYNDILRRKTPLLAKETGQLTISPILRLELPIQPNILPPSGEITLSVKGRNKLYGKASAIVIRGIVQSISTIQTQVEKGDSLYIEYHIANKTLAKWFVKSENVANADVKMSGFSGVISPSILSRIDSIDIIFGTLYRGWGQFVYNGNKERALKPINEGELKFDKNRYPKKVSNNDEGDELSKVKFLVLTADPKTHSWRGSDEFTYISNDTISSSRMGDDDIVPSSILGDTRATVPNLVTKSSSSGFAGGVTFAESIPFVSGASASENKGESQTLLRWIDINGDRVNELAGERYIQFTLPNGGWDKRILSHDLGIPNSKTNGFGLALSGSIMPQKNSYGSSTKLSTSATLSASMSLSISGNYSKSNEEMEYNWIDINGDGLTDKVYKNGMVSLCLGYSFMKPEQWYFSGIQKGKSSDFGAGSSPLSAGVNVVNKLGKTTWNGSISIGFSLQRTENQTIQAMQDVNGDGLIDLILSTQPYIVKLNMGTTFSEPITWHGMAGGYDEGVSVSEALNLAFTIGLYIPIPFTPGLKIGINPSGSIGEGANRQVTQLSDIDGDGFPDFLSSEKDGDLNVLHSTIGKTNLLKSVKRPFKAFFSMDYELAGNTYDMPNSKWVLAQTALFDGLTGDGADTMKYRFEYENGKYDRRERDFYGFETVKTYQLNTDKQDAVYRTTVQVFKNENYYEKGLLAKEWLQDEVGRKYTETHYTFELKDIVTGATLPTNFLQNDNGKNAFAALVASEKLFFEGQNTEGVKTKTTYGYDKIGNITDFEDFGDGSTNDYIKAKIHYHNSAVTKSEPSQIEVSNSRSELMRKRQTSIDAEGNVTQIRQYLNGSISANFDMEYDMYGNLTKIIRPENYDKKRFFYTYTYDDIVHSYLVGVKDAFGYTSSSQYEYLFGQLLETTDMNGQKVQYTIDDLGRVKTITGPYEIGAKDYTIAFDYNTDAEIPFATTKHYDPEHNNDIVTITFIDGLMRPVQVKKTGAINTEGGNDKVEMIVSGRVKFDAFGRTFETFYPVTEPMGNNGQMNSQFNDVPPTKVTYDVLDRTLTTTLPDNSTTKISYELGSIGSTTMFKTTVIDALNKKKETYTDVRSRHRANVDYINNRPIWTQFTYNALSELEQVTDDGNNKTEYTYDKLGRKLSIKHPDAGLTSFEYDIVGNMTKKITADIRKKIQNGGAIVYKYDFERLTEIHYPRNFQNRVKYTYGKAGDKFNRAGRIVLQEDASGGQEFYYGKLGEITKTVRTIYVNPTTVVTYISEAEYDTWNRLKTMTYPDGEKVTYKYNRAGKLLSMAGEKTGQKYNYVEKVGYDEFEQRTFLQYGNGTVTKYKYEKDRRRLSNMTVSSKNTSIINNRYAYDAMNNVLSVENIISGDNLKLGGPAKHNYRYDDLHRLVQAEGSWRRETREDSYTLNMSYDNLHNITQKVQTHIQNGRTVKETTYTQDYDYNNRNQPHTPSKIGKELYTYDANGNMIESRSENPFALNRQLITWDEENRIMNISKNGIISQFTYDAQGERVIKSSGNFTGVYINGALAGALGHEKNFTIYVSPYLVVQKDTFSKHYYIEGQRILSKIGTGDFANKDWSKTLIKAGNIDYAATFKAIYENAKEFYRGFGYPPGVPTKPYIYAHPDSTGVPTPSVSTPSVLSTDTLVRYPRRTPTAEPPGEPIKFVWVHKDSVKAGYGFEDKLKQPENKQFFYHPDHLGSTSYITDSVGVVILHMEYMPFGETFVEEALGRQPYLFNGKELDNETGLYYYGARYYNPRISMWLGVDPMAEKYAGWSPYNYTLLNPVIYTDPNGKWVETALDVISLAKSAYDFYNDPSISNAGWLALDVAAVVLPVVTGTYLAKAGKEGVNAVESVKNTSKAINEVSGDVRFIASNDGKIVDLSRTVQTEHGLAKQGIDFESIDIALKTESNSSIYRQGQFNKTETGSSGQFWQPSNPSKTQNSTAKYGMAQKGKPDWIQNSQMKDGTPFITRKAPSYGKNKGGAVEIVTPKGSTNTKSFTMPD